MFKKGKTALAVLFTGLALGGAVRANAADIDGLWHVREGEQESVVKFQPCRDDARKLCGVFHSFKGDPSPKDLLNPDPALKGRALCDAEFITDLEKQGSSDWAWDKGHVYDARAGKSYDAALRQEGDKIVFLGYMKYKFAGQKRTWNRLPPGSEPPKCRK